MTQHNGTDSEHNELALDTAQNNNLTVQEFQGSSTDLHNLEKIRDLLFGTQVRTHEQRFSRLEERLEQECKILRSDLNRRLDTLESYIHKEVTSLNEQIQDVRQVNAAAVERLQNEQQSATQGLEHKLSQLEEKMITSERNLRQQALEQNNQLTADLIERYNELLTIVEREVSILHTVDKTDRANLASFFGEISMRLQSE